MYNSDDTTKKNFYISQQSLKIPKIHQTSQVKIFPPNLSF